MKTIKQRRTKRGMTAEDFIALPDEEKNRISDAYAKSHKMKRSELFASGVSRLIKGHRVQT